MLIVAGVLAGVAGLSLVVLGWWIQGWEFHAGWSRLTDPAWWTGGVVRAAGHLVFSKLGLKAALGVVILTVMLATWLRRNRGTIDTTDSVQPDELDQNATAPS
jgi:hypothetical protein